MKKDMENFRGINIFELKRANPERVLFKLRVFSWIYPGHSSLLNPIIAEKSQQRPNLHETKKCKASLSGKVRDYLKSLAAISEEDYENNF